MEFRVNANSQEWITFSSLDDPVAPENSTVLINSSRISPRTIWYKREALCEKQELVPSKNHETARSLAEAFNPRVPVMMLPYASIPEVAAALGRNLTFTETL
ncbi:hypothetical protein JHK82_039364 [Glycine max]|nr:hypothetical protein JHK82_039364 [Glycine max]KAG5121428.1 hypothetical protein JHK84_039768 [Glycine max]